MKRVPSRTWRVPVDGKKDAEPRGGTSALTGLRGKRYRFFEALRHARWRRLLEAGRDKLQQQLTELETEVVQKPSLSLIRYLKTHLADLERHIASLETKRKAQRSARQQWPADSVDAFRRSRASKFSHAGRLNDPTDFGHVAEASTGR